MKTNINKVIFAGALALGMVSCGENSWNDHLDGFVGGPQFSDVQTLDYTLTAEDYTTIANNKANQAKAKAEGVSNELSAVGTLGYLNGQITPEGYLPGLLSDSTFQYYTLSDGSSVNLTYKVAENLPAEMVSMNAAKRYTVSEDDYKAAYGSDKNYSESFSPMAPASSNLPRILSEKYADAQSGDYVIVTYNNSDSSPVFSTPDTPPFEVSDVLNDAKVGDKVTANCIVTGICARGFIVTDKSASLLVYIGSNYDSSYAIGDQIEISGAVSQNNHGLQFDSKAVIKKVGRADNVTYPTPKVYTGADMDQAIQTTANFAPVYCEVTGTVKVSGNYYNLFVDGATTAQGSMYQLTNDQKAMLKDGEKCTLVGYFVSVSQQNKAPKFFNILLVGVKGASAKGVNAHKATRAAVELSSTTMAAIYKYDGSAWSQPGDVVVVQPSDYTEMGSNYGNLEGEQPEQYLPTFMSRKFPYGPADAVKYVVYRYFNGSATVTRSEQYEFKEGKWVNSISNEGVITQTRQFVRRGGSWKMDPSISLTLPAGKNQATSTWFYQAVVDWVKANISNGSEYIDKYGTAEYYSGCSSYQGNVNINADYSAITGNANYAGMDANAIVTLMKSRFEKETGPGALSVLYPDMAPIGDVEPTVTITFTAWTTGGTNKVYVIVFKCVEKGKFEFASCTWNDPE